jgi:predicted RNase H-like HicB family nuclease
MHLRITIERDISTGIFVASIAEIPGKNSQSDTVEAARSNLDEVIEVSSCWKRLGG